MLKIPDELELLEFFESEPFESEAQDGYFCYKAKDTKGIELYFSFNQLERSIQIRLMLLDQEFLVFSEECAEEIKLIKDKAEEYLSCIFSFNGAISEAKIRISPEIKINWYLLDA